MQTVFQGQVSKQEYSKALEIHNSLFKWIKWPCGIILAIVVLSTGVTISRNPSMTQYFLPPIVFPLIFLTFPWWIISIQAASYDQKGNIYQTPINGLIDDTGITVNSQVVKSSILWNAFTHYKKNKEMVLLYQGKSCFNIFTASLFKNENEWNQFLSEINSKVVKN
jgi:hypothetical protein